MCGFFGCLIAELAISDMNAPYSSYPPNLNCEGQNRQRDRAKVYGYHFEPWNIYGRVPASRAPLSRGAYSEYSIFHGGMGKGPVRG